MNDPVQDGKQISLATIEDVHRSALAGAGAALRIEALARLFGMPAMCEESAVRDTLVAASDAGDEIAEAILDSGVALKSRESKKTVAIDSDPCILIQPRFFSELECFYVKEISKRWMEQSLVISPDKRGVVNQSVRTSETAWLYKSRQDVLIKHLRKRILEFMHTTAEFAEPLNVVRYFVGGKFLSHLDAYRNYYSDRKNMKKTALRVATGIVYLNSSYIGGETAFVELRKKISADSGDFLYFRNVDSRGEIDRRTLHGSLPVESGEKWAMIQWVQDDNFWTS